MLVGCAVYRVGRFVCEFFCWTSLLHPSPLLLVFFYLLFFSADSLSIVLLLYC